MNNAHNSLTSVSVPTARARAQHRGFTLIELMIVCIIIAILAAVAIPNYSEYVRKGRRSDAMSALTNGAQALERSYTENMAYPTTTATFTALVPVTSSGGYYTIAFVAPLAANRWTMTATPIATSAQKGDKCGTFQLTNTGVKSVSGGTATTADCWK